MLLIDIDMTDEMRKQLLDQIENRDNSDDWLEEAEAEAKKKEKRKWQRK